MQRKTCTFPLAGLARELCDNEGAPNAIIKNNDVARHMQHPSSMVEPKDFKLFATTEASACWVHRTTANKCLLNVRACQNAAGSLLTWEASTPNKRSGLLQEGLTAVLKDAYNDRSRPRHQWTGAMLPPCAFDERNMKVAMPGWCNPCKQDYTVPSQTPMPSGRN